MLGSATPTPGDEPSHAEWRRHRQRAIEARRRWLDERDAVLESSLEAGERVVVRRRAHPLVTDLRIIHARQLRLAPRIGDWILDPLPFDEITRWASGAQHDGRPILRLEHHPRTTADRVPGRTFLWFKWGDALGLVVRTTTSFGFGRGSNPVLVAIRAELERREIPQGPRFVIRPAGTREERMASSRSVLYEAPGTAWIRSRRWRASHVLYRGELAWPLHVASWIILAVPAWFVSPWLVLPAVIGAELVWIAVGQWMWLRNRSRTKISGPRR